jgi:hypothetical protein
MDEQRASADASGSNDRLGATFVERATGATLISLSTIIGA